MTAGTAARYGRVLGSFGRFITARGFGFLADVDPPTCSAFVYAARSGEIPAASTSRLRLTVVREAFLVLGRLDVVSEDPTSGLRVHPAAPARRPAPLTPPEMARLRSAGRMFPRDRLRPATIELALAGASHMEVATTVVADVDLAAGRVRFGSRSTALEPFAVTTLTARIASCRQKVRRLGQPWEPNSIPVALHRPLHTYPETSVAPSVSSNLSRAMSAAGLTRPGLRPASVREYAANRYYALTGRIEDLAAFLGLGSLDVARGFIDPVWQDRYGEEVRAFDGHA